MKLINRKLLILFSPYIAYHALYAAVPVRWTVETSRVQPAVFEAYQGETLDLAASLQSYGRPVAIPGPASLYWQTNGMGARWWTAPASVSSNVLSAVWSPTNDVGSRVYTCFIGQTGSNYRAEFQLRLRPSPGATPNLLPLPTVTYDARLNGTPTINGTNLIDYVVAASGAEVDPTVPDWAKQPNPPQSGTDENAVRAIVGSFASTGTVHRASSVGNAETWTDATGCVWQIDRSLSDSFSWTSDPPGYESRISVGWGNAFGSTDPYWWYRYEYMPGQWSSWANLSYDFNMQDRDILLYLDGRDVTFHLVRGYEVSTNLVGRLALTNDVPSSPADIGAAPASVADTVQAWQTYWDGDDVRVTVTNYYGSVDIPHLYIEQKMPADDTHDAEWFKTIWDEMTRWSSFLSSYADMTNHVEQDLADRAWGVYDSSTGAYSPDGLLQVSQPEIQIAAGLAYQKTITNGGELWVLTATEPMAVGGESTNGYFRITDGEGNPLFEIVNGDKRVVGATAGGIRVIGDEVQIDYMLSDNSSVEIRRTTNLRNGTWETIDATWTGTSGAYTAHVAKPTGPSAFYKASYEVGGETYIKHTAPAGFDRVHINGHTYSVSVETVNGKKLMVLTDD